MEIEFEQKAPFISLGDFDIGDTVSFEDDDNTIFFVTDKEADKNGGHCIGVVNMRTAVFNYFSEERPARLRECELYVRY